MPRKTIEETYQKKTPLEHVLLRPDTYVGSVEKEQQKLWVLKEVDESSGLDLNNNDDDNNNNNISNSSKPKTRLRMVEETIEFVPALYKIFDEILVNAADNKQRDKNMSYIEVVVNEEMGFISIENDGRGIPIEIHKEHNMYVPELIFGNLLTSSNYDDKEHKTTGGRNGYGAKLANIFSTKFTVETVDSEQGKKYRQTWQKNMTKRADPKISDSNKDDYTKVTFYPDFGKFGMESFEPGILKLIKKRVYDVAGCTPKDLKVKYNGATLKVNDFATYAKLYFKNSLRKGTDYWHVKPHDSWEVIFAISEDNEFRQISHVNSIWTIKGGQHVNHVTKQFIDYFKENFKPPRGKGRDKGSKEIKESLKPKYVKDHLVVFVNCLIVNPAFSSQTKETLTTKMTNFGSRCKLPDDMLKSATNKISSDVYEFLEMRARQQSRKTDGSKKTRLTLDAEYDDAKKAGTKESQQCTLILTEGLSAKTLAVAGVGVLPGGKQYYGIVPLKGKLLNVRDESAAKINRNKEITVLKQMLGLKSNTDYSVDANFKKLRYGHIMVMTDQDYDGSHIKGLIINFIHSMWPQLLQREGFLQQFITPIVVATKKGKKKKNDDTDQKYFYTVPEYEQWKEDLGENLKKWKTKYYKGLGTWGPKEGKEHFRKLSKHQVYFSYTGNDDDTCIVKAFAKKMVEERKIWLSNYRIGTYLDFSNSRASAIKEVTYHDFIDRDLILFSVEDNKRSIPALMDGFKPGQRKVLYSCFMKNNLKSEVRVAQLSGFVSEKSAYHHGEASLNGTIINMAQDFVGSNNINLLEPRGMFGSRLKGGKDAASPRYISTRLCDITRKIFHEHDDTVLTYLEDDGMPVEPEYYVPILPMVLINGCEGIGTGWSTFVPNYNPHDVIKNLRLKLRGEPLETMTPDYRGFKGTVEVRDRGSANSFGAESSSLSVSLDVADLLNGSGSGSNNNNNNNNASSNGNVGGAGDVVTSYTTRGVCEILQDETEDTNEGKVWTIKISELPVRSWTEVYKKYLLDLEEAGQIKEFTDESTDMDVVYYVKILQSKRPKSGGAKGAKGRGKKKKKNNNNSEDSDDDTEMVGNNERSSSPKRGAAANAKKTLKKKIYFEGQLDEQFLKDMKLAASISTKNMVLFDSENKLKRYATVDDIFEEFYEKRMEFYQKRKDSQLEHMQHELTKLSNQVRFINMILNDELQINRRKKKLLVAELIRLKFDTWKKKASFKDKVKKMGDENEDDAGDGDNGDGDDGDNEDSLDVDEDVEMNGNGNNNNNNNNSGMDDAQLKKYADGYNYLLNMPLLSLTYEKVKQLEKQKDTRHKEINALKVKPTKTMWKEDLNEFEKALEKFDAEYENNLEDMRKEAKGGPKGAAKKGKGKGKGKGKTQKKTTKAKTQTKPAASKTKTKTKKEESLSATAKEVKGSRGSKAATKETKETRALKTSKTTKDAKNKKTKKLNNGGNTMKNYLIDKKKKQNERKSDSDFDLDDDDDDDDDSDMEVMTSGKHANGTKNGAKRISNGKGAKSKSKSKSKSESVTPDSDDDEMLVSLSDRVAKLTPSKSRTSSPKKDNKTIGRKRKFGADSDDDSDMDAEVSDEPPKKKLKRSNGTRDVSSLGRKKSASPAKKSNKSKGKKKKKDSFVAEDDDSDFGMSESEGSAYDEDDDFLDESTVSVKKVKKTKKLVKGGKNGKNASNGSKKNGSPKKKLSGKGKKKSKYLDDSEDSSEEDDDIDIVSGGNGNRNRNGNGNESDSDADDKENAEPSERKTRGIRSRRTRTKVSYNDEQEFDDSYDDDDGDFGLGDDDDEESEAYVPDEE